jgi:hypothetical protein
MITRFIRDRSLSDADGEDEHERAATATAATATASADEDAATADDESAGDEFAPGRDSSEDVEAEVEAAEDWVDEPLPEWLPRD